MVSPVPHIPTSYLEDREPLALNISMQTPKQKHDMLVEIVAFTALLGEISNELKNTKFEHWYCMK